MTSEPTPGDELLEQSRARIQHVVDQLPMAVTEMDRDHRVVFANRTALAMVGFEPEKILGLRVPDVLGADAWAFQRPYAERALAGQTVTTRNPHETPDGQRLVMEVTHNPSYGPDGEVQGYFSYARDITAQATLEQRLARSDRLASIGQLSGGIAHDFNNLLAVIRGNAEMIAGDIPAEGDVGRRLDAVLEAVARGASLTARLLAFAGQQALEPGPCDVNAVVEEMVTMLERAIGPSIELHARLAPYLQQTHLDVHQLENAILNLAINARDAMPHGGALTIATESVVLTEDAFGPGDPPESATFVRLSVTDAGTGMDASTLERAHEPFFTTKPVGEGSGLGLSMVDGFVRQSGGRLEIDSRPGGGTTVHLYLPVDD